MTVAIEREISAHTATHDVPTGWLNRLTSTRDWRQYFTDHRQMAVTEVGKVAPTDEGTRRALVRSIRRFQAGEASGSHLAVDIWTAHDTFLDEDARHAIAMFIAEENRHGELLEKLLAEMNASVATRDASAMAFTFARRLLGMRTKLIVLNVAEIVGAAFYASVAEYSDDAATSAVCAAIRDDEFAHLAFGVMLLRRMIDAPGSPATKALRRFVIVNWLRLMMASALVVVSVDQAPYLRRAGFASVIGPSISRTRWFTAALNRR